MELEDWLGFVSLGFRKGWKLFINTHKQFTGFWDITSADWSSPNSVPNPFIFKQTCNTSSSILDNHGKKNNEEIKLKTSDKEIGRR